MWYPFTSCVMSAIKLARTDPASEMSAAAIAAWVSRLIIRSQAQERLGLPTEPTCVAVHRRVAAGVGCPFMHVARINRT